MIESSLWTLDISIFSFFATFDLIKELNYMLLTICSNDYGYQSSLIPGVVHLSY